MTTFTARTPSALSSRNPATGEVVGEVPITPVGDIAVIVARARNAQPVWSKLGSAKRAQILRPLAQALIDRAEALGPLLSEEMGKPLREAIGEAKQCGQELPTTLDQLVEAFEPDVLQDAKTESFVYHDPLGVCAAITPWNFPLAMPTGA